MISEGVNLCLTLIYFLSPLNIILEFCAGCRSEALQAVIDITVQNSGYYSTV